MNELMKFGTMAAYHQWERYMKELLGHQLGRVPKPKGNEGMVMGLLNVLEQELSAPTAPQCRAILEECRRVTNALKHDVDYHQLEADLPAYFVPGQEPPEDRFRITEDHLRRFINAICDFWENLPHEVDYSGEGS